MAISPEGQRAQFKWVELIPGRGSLPIYDGEASAYVPDSVKVFALGIQIFSEGIEPKIRHLVVKLHDVATPRQ
jgi:hypothetical protein